MQAAGKHLERFAVFVSARPVFAAILLAMLAAATALAIEPVPDKLVVLTFDDASKSHFTVARPLLKKYGFGATFFVTEGFDFTTNKRDYMSWQEIAQLHRDGFEIGNHTRDHRSVVAETLDQLPLQIESINNRCAEYGIAKPISFAYPGNANTKDALSQLRALGIQFARRGGSPEYPYREGRGFAYEPSLDHPLLIPSAGDARPDWTLDDFIRAVSQARHGRIAVLQFHGVPDTAHDWVSSPVAQFEAYLKYLADHDCQVIAMRDLARFVDPQMEPSDPWGVIKDRERQVAAGAPKVDYRPATNDDDLRYWLENMSQFHHFSPSEMGAALGLPADELTEHLRRFHIDTTPHGPRSSEEPLLVVPYPGGRHPRAGFRDGAIRPQRETKFSVFPPWPDGGYAVVDVPEAVWFESAGQRELLYLAHTHIPTFWDKRGEVLPPLEWQRHEDGSLDLVRHLPNQVTLASEVHPTRDGVRMRFRVTNGSKESLRQLNVQVCVLLQGLVGFDQRTNDNKRFASPLAACHDTSGKRWQITAWQHAVRTWGNPRCPCIHSDPQVPDCNPGEDQFVEGWLSFYEGDDIDAEFRRLRDVIFQDSPR